MQFSKEFSIPTLVLDTFQELGSIEGTFWGCFVTQNYNSETYRINIFRSRSDSAVEIDLKVTSPGCSELNANGCRISNGLKQIAFNLIDNLDNFLITGWTGYLKIYYNSSKKEEITETFNYNIPLSLLANDLLHLLDNPDPFSDATLVCGTFKIPVHRNILSARSPVFAAMFKTQMQEGLDGVVDIVDVELDVLQVMLRYVYSGNTDHLTSSLAGDMLFAADKYQLKELKLYCAQLLEESMAGDNVFRSLVLGDLHDAGLKKYAVEFICKHRQFSDLEKAEEWQSLMKERPSLALEVTTTVVKYLQKK